MPSILNLKFKGNKSFVAFSNLNDAESLTKTWKVCTKVASYLEQGQRLENLSWRLWHLQNLMVDTDNAKSKREFKKLSKCMGDKLDKEKGRSIEELPAPDFKRTPSTDLLRQRAVEKERTREASLHTPEHTLQRMQFTFAVDPPQASATTTTTSNANNANGNANATNAMNANGTTFTSSAKNANGPAHSHSPSHTTHATAPGSVRLPTLFSTSFGPTALLAPLPSLAPRMNYGEAHTHTTGGDDAMRVRRPTIELPLDELLHAEGDDDAHDAHNADTDGGQALDAGHEHDEMAGMGISRRTRTSQSSTRLRRTTSRCPPRRRLPPIPARLTRTRPPRPRATATPRSTAARKQRTRTTARRWTGTRWRAWRRTSRATTAGTTRRTLISLSAVPRRARGNAVPAMRPPAAPHASANASSNPNGGNGASASVHGNGAGNANGSNGNGSGNGGNMTASAVALNANSAPGGVKAECSNCGATHTPLWRRGLNDELNCNACGLYCKLHKRPRPKTMRNAGGGGEGRGHSVRTEALDVMAQCYNCHTTATPLWRKDDEGKTVCNACGLYYKLHGSARPISMKSDVIRKRSRHDARRGGASASVSETPTASPGVSRRASPAPAGHSSHSSASAGRASPTLAPDSTTTHSYDTSSELASALGTGSPPYGRPYPYHEQYPDALPFASVDVGSELEQARALKRRRMSVDSASEPPSSAASYASYADGYTSGGSQFSMEFPFSRFPAVSYNDGAHGNGGENGNGGGAALRGVAGGNAFWHPPMLLHDGGSNPNGSPGGFLHPPMLPTAEDAPMDYLHPPMVRHHNSYQQQEEESLNNFFGGFMQSNGLHPPMLPGDEAQMMGMMGGAHPPMMPYDDVYDASGNINMHY
ncbi:GATA-binding factor 6-B [Mycena vulgaris]|nr:GATA-binding factor 6-B [Mycena vulgaris]